MSKLLLLPGSFVADYCLPPLGESGLSLTPYFVNDEFLASYGILLGMVVVTRKLRADEEPPDDSLCYLRVSGTSLLVHVSLAADGTIRLEDDTARREFSSDEVEFEAVALYACSCNRLGTLCTPAWLSVGAGLTLFTEKVGPLHWEADALGHLSVGGEMGDWLSLVGEKPEEWEGWGWVNFLHHEDADAFTARWKESLETGGPYVNQGRIRFGGVWVKMASTANPVKDASGRIVGWEGFAHFEPLEKRQMETRRERAS